MTVPYEFGPAAAGEQAVFGACRPGHDRAPPGTGVGAWLAFVRDRGVSGVVCLLADAELAEYDDLLGAYRETFGADATCHAPVEDFETVDPLTFERVVAFCRARDRRGERTVVHCSAGSGRTGHVLVGWLACERGYELKAAVRAVQATGRRPLEGGKTLADLREAFDC